MSPEKEKEVEAEGDWRQKGGLSSDHSSPPATFFAASCSLGTGGWACGEGLLDSGDIANLCGTLQRLVCLVCHRLPGTHLRGAVLALLGDS